MASGQQGQGSGSTRNITRVGEAVITRQQALDGISQAMKLPINGTVFDELIVLVDYDLSHDQLRVVVDSKLVDPLIRAVRDAQYGESHR